MAIGVHRGVRRFELSLFGLGVCFAVLAAVYLWHKAWLVGISMLTCWFLTSVIGQALPHRKQQTGSELASGIPPVTYDGELSSNDAFGLAKAGQGASLLTAVAALIIAWHHGCHWYTSILTAIGAYLVFFFVVTLFSLKPSRSK